jgi:hypothetical protein
MAARWMDLMLMGALGDQSLRFMDLRTFLQTWADVHYGVLVGGALLVAVLAQVGLTNALIDVAARRASRPRRE